MTKQDLASALKRMYENNLEDGPTMIRLFGIKYSEELKNCNASNKEIIEISGIDKGTSYQAEISKGIKLAKYVQLK